MARATRSTLRLPQRKLLAGEATAVAKHTSGIVESIRQLRVAREGAVKARTAALNQLYELVVTAPDELRQQLAARKTSRGKASLCLRLRPDRAQLHEPLQAAKLALRSVAERVRELDRQIEPLDQHLAPLVATAAPRTTSLLGVSTQHAGQLLATAGQNIERLPNDGAFAHLCGASPIPASSGRTSKVECAVGFAVTAAVEPVSQRATSRALTGTDRSTCDTRQVS